MLDTLILMKNFQDETFSESTIDDDYEMIDISEIPKYHLSAEQVAFNAVELAYGVGRKQFIAKDARINGAILPGSGWEMLCTSEGSDFGYKAVCLVNRETKEVHIASAGTIPSEPHDLLDDVRLLFGHSPNKLHPLKTFINKVIASLGGDAATAGYQFSTSGHSLGAVVADLTGLELISRGIKTKGSITFENPGSEKVLEDRKIFSGPINNQQFEQFRSDSKVYNAKPNFINRTANQFGKCILVLQKKVEKLKKESLTKAPKIATGYLKGFRDKISSLAANFKQLRSSGKATILEGTAAFFSGLTIPWLALKAFEGAQQFAKVIEEHKLGNFSNMGSVIAIPVQGGDSGQLIVEKGHLLPMSEKQLRAAKGNDLLYCRDFSSLVDVHGICFEKLREFMSAEEAKARQGISNPWQNAALDLSMPSIQTGLASFAMTQLAIAV